MKPQPDYTKLFQALLEARASYANLRHKGASRSDEELARDPDYHRLHRSGVTIGMIGGEEAIASAIRCFGNEDATDKGLVKTELSRLWCGMGNWQH
jgi:hypothetical protein